MHKENVVVVMVMYLFLHNLNLIPLLTRFLVIMHGSRHRCDHYCD